jgi:hypothetical protein
VVTRVCGYGELAVAPACQRGPQEKKRGEGMGENRPGLRILLPKTCKSDAVASYARASSHAAARPWRRSAMTKLNVQFQVSKRLTDNRTLSLHIS